jgi:hypothetical protein
MYASQSTEVSAWMYGDAIAVNQSRDEQVNYNLYNTSRTTAIYFFNAAATRAHRATTDTSRIIHVDFDIIIHNTVHYYSCNSSSQLVTPARKLVSQDHRNNFAPTFGKLLLHKYSRGQVLIHMDSK